jgi:hypothetical protein
MSLPGEVLPATFPEITEVVLMSWYQRRMGMAEHWFCASRFPKVRQIELQMPSMEGNEGTVKFLIMQADSAP